MSDSHSAKPWKRSFSVILKGVVLYILVRVAHHKIQRAMGRKDDNNDVIYAPTSCIRAPKGCTCVNRHTRYILSDIPRS